MRGVICWSLVWLVTLRVSSIALPILDTLVRSVDNSIPIHGRAETNLFKNKYLNNIIVYYL